MKILHTVASVHPPTGGMQEVIRQLSKRLAALGHDVTIAADLTPAATKKAFEGIPIVEFDVKGTSVNGMSGECERYERFLLESDFDVITNFAAQHWATDLMLPLLDRIRAKKVFVPTGFSALYRKDYEAYFEEMKKAMPKYDMNVFHSEDYRDINFARDCGVKKMTLIPNGAAEDEFLADSGMDIRKILGIGEKTFFILHVGSHTGLKGHREAIEIFKKAKIGESCFLIVSNPSGGACQKDCARSAMRFNYTPARLFDGKRLVVTSLPRSETVAAFKAADLFLFPSNIECSPIVLFECMAARTPYLSTDVGNAREILKWSGSGLILPTVTEPDGSSKARIPESARMLESLRRDPEKRDRMQDAGFRAWRSRFSWEQIALKYEFLYESLVIGK